MSKGGVHLNSKTKENRTIQSASHRFLIATSCKDISYLTIILIILNLFDVLLSNYAINILGFMELNPFAAGFPPWIFVLKFGVCFIPMFCAYILNKFGMENYLLLPFLCSLILIQFYTLVVTFNVHSILGV
jgi:hypothetical protein